MPILGVLAFELATEVAFFLRGCWAGGCALTVRWTMLSLVSSSHCPAEVGKVGLIYLQEQIKINLSPFFLCILKEVHTLSQLRGAGPHWGSYEGRWEIGCCLFFLSARAIKGEGAVPSPATAPHVCMWGAGGAGCLCPRLLFPFLPAPPPLPRQEAWPLCEVMPPDISQAL